MIQRAALLKTYIVSEGQNPFYRNVCIENVSHLIHSLLIFFLNFALPKCTNRRLCSFRKNILPLNSTCEIDSTSKTSSRCQNLETVQSDLSPKKICPNLEQKWSLCNKCPRDPLLTAQKFGKIITLYEKLKICSAFRKMTFFLKNFTVYENDLRCQHSLRNGGGGLEGPKSVTLIGANNRYATPYGFFGQKPHFQEI